MAICKCGRKMSKYANSCKPCHEQKMVAIAIEFVRVQQLGKCPDCGNVLVPNNSLAGTYWLQCRGYGRLRQPGDKECSFQVLADTDKVHSIKVGMDDFPILNEGDCAIPVGDRDDPWR